LNFNIIQAPGVEKRQSQLFIQIRHTYNNKKNDNYAGGRSGQGRVDGEEFNIRKIGILSPDLEQSVPRACTQSLAIFCNT